MKIAVFPHDHPQLVALCDIMRIAKLTTSQVVAGLFAVAYEADPDGPAVRHIADAGLQTSFPVVAEALGWSDEKLLRELVTYLCESYIDAKLREEPPPRERMN